MTLKIAYNTTDSPVVVDDLGYFIGGRSWGVVDSLDPVAKAELKSRRLVDVDEDALAASDNVEARAAVAALADRRARLEAAKATHKDDLIDQLGDAADDLEVGGDGKPRKAELVEVAVAEATADGDPVPPAPVEAPAEAKTPAPKTPAKKSTSRAAAKK